MVSQEAHTSGSDRKVSKNNTVLGEEWKPEQLISHGGEQIVRLEGKNIYLVPWPFDLK